MSKEPKTYQQAVALSRKDRSAAETKANKNHMNSARMKEILDAAAEAALFLIQGHERRGDFDHRRVRGRHD